MLLRYLFLLALSLLFLTSCDPESTKTAPLYEGRFPNGTTFFVLFESRTRQGHDGYPMLLITGHHAVELPKQGLYDAAYEGTFSSRPLDEHTVLLEATREGHDTYEYRVSSGNGLLSYEVKSKGSSRSE